MIRISVCMATFNGSKYVRAQIESIIQQLGEQDELIISDNGSTDGTIEIIKNFNDSRIKLLCHKNTIEYSNLYYKVSANFENSLKGAKGKYIFLSDQDDIWYPDKINEFLKFLENDNIVQSNYSIINQNNQCIEYSHYRRNPIFNNPFLNLLFHPFHGCCLAFPAAVLNIVLPFPKNLIMHDNWIGIVGQLSKYKIAYIEKPLLYYRRHTNNVSPTNSKNNIYFKISYRFKLCLQIMNRIFTQK